MTGLAALARLFSDPDSFDHMLFATRTRRTVINLALQGGGAHGAFTWGVLDRLLEDGRLDFEGLSGSSAGAMNAVMLAEGLRRGGRDGARELLSTFWTRIAASVPIGFAVPMDDGSGVALAPTARLMLHWAQFVSPYQFNPLNLNPLRDLLADLVDFECLRRTKTPRLFVAATRAETGGLRLFRNHELDVPPLLASACLPNLQHAVEIDGDAYWDGAFAANPAIFPLFYECASRDTLLVLLSPSKLGPAPRTVQGIRERTMELAFTAPLMRELHMFSRARAFAAASLWRFGRLDRRIMQSRFHLIDAHASMGEFAAETKLAPHMSFLVRLYELGVEQAQTWLALHGDKIGKQSSLDLSALLERS